MLAPPEPGSPKFQEVVVMEPQFEPDPGNDVLVKEIVWFTQLGDVGEKVKEGVGCEKMIIGLYVVEAVSGQLFFAVILSV